MKERAPLQKNAVQHVTKPDGSGSKDI